MTARAVEHLSQEIVEGKPYKELQPLVDELFESTQLDDEDLVALYKHLPRPLTGKYVEKVLKVDKTAEVAHLLLASDFEGLDEFRYAKRPTFFHKLVDTSLSQITDRAGTLSSSEQAQTWRRYLIASKSPEVNLEGHAYAAMKVAVEDPQTFVFEPYVDTLEGVTLKLDAAKKYLALLKEVFVAGSGSAGLAKFNKANADFLKSEGITAEVERKAKLLSLCSFLKTDSTVSFDDLKKHLGADSDAAVESAVVDASLARIIDAAVNKEERIVQVHYVQHLKFDQAAWKDLAEQLKKWKDLTQECINA